MDRVLPLLDVDSLLSPEEKQIRDAVKRFVDDRVRKSVPGWYEDGILPARELARELGALGVLGMHLEGYGCAGTGAVAYGLACMELEAGDSGVRSLVSVQGSLAMFAIHRFGSEEQRREWLPPMAAGSRIGCFGLTEPDHGSDAAGMKTWARRDGPDWLIHGTKMWITNGGIADVAVVWARTERGVRGFLVPADAPGFSANDIKGKLSLRASVTSELVLDDVRVPKEAELPSAAGVRAALTCLDEARFGIVFGVLGAARDCVETALTYAGQREQFGKPIASFQLTQQKLTDMAIELVKATLLAIHIGRLKERGVVRPEQISFGKLNNVREALHIARQARTILGAYGITGEYSLLRHANNLESVLTYEGTSEIHTLIVGQALTGISAF